MTIRKINGQTIDADTLDGSHLADLPSPAKEFFVPIGLVITDWEDKGDFHGKDLDSSGDWAKFNFKVPHDFTTLTSCVIVVIRNSTGGTGTIDWTVTTDFGVIGEAYNINSDTVTQDGLALPEGTLFYELDIAEALTNLTAGDYVGVKLIVDATSGSAPVFFPIGITFKYS